MAESFARRIKSWKWDWNPGGVFAELAFGQGSMVVIMSVTPLLAVPAICCSALHLHWVVHQSLWARKATPICQNIVLLQPIECPARLDLHHLSLLAPFPFSFPVTFLSFPLDPDRHLSQALVVSLHAAANSPPSATIPTVGSTFL